LTNRNTAQFQLGTAETTDTTDFDLERSVPCSRCKAEVGEPCQSVNGTPLASAHQVRRKAATEGRAA
jgi:hypothetical protein